MNRARLGGASQKMRGDNVDEIGVFAGFSLTPCFSWVFVGADEIETASAVCMRRKTAEAVEIPGLFLTTQLKQGVNEIRPKTLIFLICARRLKTHDSFNDLTL